MLGRPCNKQNSPLPDTPRGRVSVLQAGAVLVPLQGEARGKRAETSRRLMILDFAYGCVPVPASSPPGKCQRLTRLSGPLRYPHHSLDKSVLSALWAGRSYRWWPQGGGKFCENTTFWVLLSSDSWSACALSLPVPPTALQAPADLLKRCVFGPRYGRFCSGSLAENRLSGMLNSSPSTVRGSPCPE